MDIVKDWNDEFYWVSKREYPDPASAVEAVMVEEWDHLYFTTEPAWPSGVYATVGETRLRGCVGEDHFGEADGFHWHPEPKFKYGSPVWEIQLAEIEWADALEAAG